MKNKQKLEKTLLKLLPTNNKLELGDKTFLTGYLDGSDKIYGFINYGGRIFVNGNGCIYPISDMESGDIRYIFNLSSIYKDILKNVYDIIELEDYEIHNLSLRFGK